MRLLARVRLTTRKWELIGVGVVLLVALLVFTSFCNRTGITPSDIHESAAQSQALSEEYRGAAREAATALRATVEGYTAEERGAFQRGMDLRMKHTCDDGRDALRDEVANLYEDLYGGGDERAAFLLGWQEQERSLASRPLYC